MLGPVVHYLNSLEVLNTSNERVRDLIRGKFKDQLPPSGAVGWVDVRDLALAHVKAIEVPEAGGKRFFITEGIFSNKQLADVLRETHPELRSKLPSEDAKDDFPYGAFELDNTRSKEVLGIKYKSLKETVKDTADSLLELGAGKE